MKEAEYVETQHQVQMYAALLREMDLEDFITTLNRADAVGAFMDPTLYREALQSGKLDLVRDVALALRDAQREIARAEAIYRERSGEEAPDP